MLSPEYFDTYIGQEKAKNNIRQIVETAKKTKTIYDPLDHMLLSGPSGLGKTSLVEIVAKELRRPLRKFLGPHLDDIGKLYFLSSLSTWEIIFIDEIHALPPKVEEALYEPMDSSKWMGKDIYPFTLIGATTKEGGLSKPLRSRFTIAETFDFYTVEELATIIKQSAKLLDLNIEDNAATIIAQRSRGVPRLANQYLKRVSYYNRVITLEIAQNALDKIGVDENGLDRLDVEILTTIHKLFNGGPVGVASLASVVGEDLATIESLREPYLVREGFLQRKSRGRILTPKAIEYLKEKYNG